MRNYFLALGLVAMSMQAVAQNHNHAYNRTVFNDATANRPLEAGLLENTRSQVTRNFPGWNINLDKVSGTFNDIYGNALNVPGNSNEAKAVYVMDNYLKDMGINRGEWHKVRDQATPKAAFVDYEQSFNNHPVLFARISFRFTKDGRLVRVKNTSYGTPGKANVQLSAQDVLNGGAIMEDANSITVTNKEVAADWVWFPIPAGNGYELHPAWQVSVSGKEENGHPVELTGYIDATNGELLYRYNKIEETTDLTVKGMVYATNTLTPATLEPLGNVKVTINNGTPINVNGNGFIADPANNITADFVLEGLWSKVIVAGGVGTPAFSGILLSGTGNDYVFPNTGSSSDRAVNAYYHTNRVHDFMKPYFPGFNALDFALTTNVDVTGNTCNAFFNGTSINFYAAGGGCNSFAEIGDIVYHEYGHGINSFFYNFQGTNFSNGAMGEGTADVWGMSITKDSILGRNTSGPASSIRRYDINPKVYPADIKGEVHADGEIIAGAWFDFAKNMNKDFTTMTDIFAATYYDLPNGPNGTEGAVYHDVLISALLNDDDDANFSNGTPHFTELVTAFARHGIYLLGDAVLTHTELAHQPAGAPINVTATLTLTNPEFFQSLKMMYKSRTSTTWDTLTMVDNNGTFSATIPAQPSGTIIDYYFNVYDMLSLPSAIFPFNFFTDASLVNMSNLPYQFAVGIHVVKQTTFEDGPQTDWTLGATGDNATAGTWIQAKPIGTFSSGIPVQTGKDHTTGSGECMVTGNSTGSSINSGDVDGGKTTLLSPPLNLTGYVYPMIEYYRWFSNDRGSNRRNDSWQVQIKSANGAVWYNVENTLQADNSWRRKIFALNQYMTINYDVTVRFIATDKATTGNQTIEAAVDDFFLYDGVPLAVNELAPAKADIYPNPASGYIQVVLPVAISGTMSMYDATGSAINTYTLDGTHTHYTINTGSYVPGNYTLLIHADNKTIQSHKVTIVHQ